MKYDDNFFFDIGFYYDNIRDGQKKFMIEEIKAIENSKNLIVEAPTGIGKTLASLCPAIFLAKKLNKKILFLTSRQTQTFNVIKTIREISNKRDERIRYSVFVSKFDMCSHEKVRKVKREDFNDFCKDKKDKRECSYFSNTYADELFKIRDEVLENTYENFNSVEEFKDFVSTKREVLFNEKKTHCGFCPYEMMSLNLASSEVIVCDYNHIFKKKLLENLLAKTNSSISDFILIVDEAHNTPDRVRNLYTQTFDYGIIKSFSIEIKNFIEEKKFDNYVLVFKKTLDDLYKFREKEYQTQYEIKNSEFLDFLKSNLVNGNKDEAIENLLDDLKTISKIVLQIRTKSYAKKIYDFIKFLQNVNSNSFINILEITNKNEINFNIKLQIKLLDPKIVCKNVLNETHSTILMSATLSPVEMYREILGIENSVEISLESPFSKKNHMVLVDSSVTTKYTQRTKEMLLKISKNVEKVMRSQNKNMIFFFPSYDFLNKILENINLNLIERRILVERRNLPKKDKEFFLNEFKKSTFRNVVLFAVSSGNFSEGIDLKENFLEMVCVIGVPFAPPDIYIKNLIKYFDLLYGKGVEYGYMNPAMTKIIQASGRCIRSERDKGVIVLMDNRFLSQEYVKCFPSFWNLKQSFDLENEIKDFFE